MVLNNYTLFWTTAVISRDLIITVFIVSVESYKKFENNTFSNCMRLKHFQDFPSFIGNDHQIQTIEIRGSTGTETVEELYGKDT